jgi:hypothetical protein
MLVTTAIIAFHLDVDGNHVAPSIVNANHGVVCTALEFRLLGARDTIAFTSVPEWRPNSEFG